MSELVTLHTVDKGQRLVDKHGYIAEVEDIQRHNGLITVLIFRPGVNTWRRYHGVEFEDHRFRLYTGNLPKTSRQYGMGTKAKILKEILTMVERNSCSVHMVISGEDTDERRRVYIQAVVSK